MLTERRRRGRVAGALAVDRERQRHGAEAAQLVEDLQRLRLPAKDVGVEMFSLSKTDGMAGGGWGFVGNTEIVARVTLLQDHVRAGIFRPVQEAGIAALRGPQESVAERVARYQARRGRVLEVVGPVRCEGTFYVWFELPAQLTAERLLTEERLAVAPGEGFGDRGTGRARISVATTDESLDAGLGRLRRALA